MIFERSPSLYFAHSRSDAFIGNAGPEIPTGASVRVLGLVGADTLDVISVVG